MSPDYVEKRNGGYYLQGSRVSLDSVIQEFLEGASPETIADDFPSLSLEAIYGAITYYLANRKDLDAYLAGTIKLSHSARKNQPPIPVGLKKRLERARRELASKRS